MATNYLRIKDMEVQLKTVVGRGYQGKQTAVHPLKFSRSLRAQNNTVQYGVMQHDRVMQRFELFAKTRRMSYMMTRRY